MVYQYQGGAQPVLAEPLHQYERQALQAMGQPSQMGGGAMQQALGGFKSMQANPQAFAQQYINPQAQQYIQNAGTYTTRGASPITMQQAQEVANPYASALKNRLTEEGERLRGAILSKQGQRGGASFGDSSFGDQMGALQRELLSKSSDIDYSIFNDAFGQLQQLRNREMQAGGQFGNLATQAQGLGESGHKLGLGGLAALFGAGQDMTAQGERTTDRQLQAGGAIRAYNQAISDQVLKNELTGQGSDADKISQLLQFLQSYQSNTETGGTPDRPGGLQGLMGGLTQANESGLGELLNDLIK